jgi:hypothetical protein
LNKKQHLPFQNIPPQGWYNLALAAVIAILITFSAYVLINDLTCQSFGLDFCAYWSAGRIINEWGFAGVYDPDLLTQYQKQVFIHHPNTDFEPFAVMYFPVFLVPFKFLSYLQPSYSYLVWTLINLAALFFYLSYFNRKVFGEEISGKILMLIFVSLPVLVNFQEGQVNIWLLICAGEFLRAFLSDQYLKAGLWLGGWLLKPQLFILMVPFLLITRSFKIIKGLIISSAVILFCSFLLVGTDGVLELLNLILVSSQGGFISNPAAMVNWRMLGWHIDTLTSSNLGSTITIIGSLITACIALIAFRRGNSTPNEKVIAILGIFAATCAVTWHAHLHMVMILIPPMLYLTHKKDINKLLFLAWVFLPIIFQAIGNSIAEIFFSNGYVVTSIQVTGLGRGLPGLLFNLIIICWAILQFTLPNDEKQNKV